MIKKIRSSSKNIIIKIVKKCLTEKKYMELIFYRVQGYKLNLNNPKTLSEKIQWMKLYWDLEKLGEYIDKYEVRKYVEKKVGKEFLIPLIGVYENEAQINFEDLPKSFIIKATHASGWNFIVKNKNNINYKEVLDKIAFWTNTSFYNLTGERNYKHVTGRVVIEELVEDPSGDLKDYKFFCFDGQPKFIQVDGDRHEEHKRNIYDTEWNKLDVSYVHGNLAAPIPKPDKLNEMLDVAKKLSSDFKFVRVDLYYTNNKVYFGELTFTPGQGFEKFSNKKYDDEFGGYLNLGGKSIYK
ncbi:hypothetical protein AF331_18770 [Rossellomorea marisflavi]|uniref:Uncharacterized protein n=1 Tax=Rossellomorea marisflavi TaxID=189381 RepID=A0A0M0FZE9_9BACI|nr:ATP-grasp fold amidoligase family protein [Rossellomorea marisflavi]KON82893.1 hypothetical protein AF331_18770 [Rossellomorea marisflavi]